MFRRKRGNFPSKGKSGICRIQGCPQMGKMLKRLDNHLSKYHKGVTRRMNDRQPHFKSKSCVADYHAKLEEKKESKNQRKQNPFTDDTIVAESNQAKEKRNESSDNDESTGEVSDVVPETESSDEALSEEESSDRQSKSVDEDAVESCRPSQHAEELNSDEYCEQTLRYLVHKHFISWCTISSCIYEEKRKFG
ncbi:hypothetical protein OS493_037833 [Desmophyllum pertusum]|uniref:Uncharacterized protein n=1 Tax=Desmophyllum pertusum TaxID=174260 RepID=A0A9W9YU93_9CNID|nr:hypothetical protein OS493_037833 [Desmophyllum pertusum]